MNSERTQAYGRVVKTLEDLGPAKLQPAEQDRVRDAADTLIFAADLDEARAALEDVDALAEHLVASGRWSEERAEAARRRPAGLRARHRRRLGPAARLAGQPQRQQRQQRPLADVLGVPAVEGARVALRLRRGRVGLAAAVLAAALARPAHRRAVRAEAVSVARAAGRRA